MGGVVKKRVLAMGIFLAISLAGCCTWSSSSVTPPSSPQSPAASSRPTSTAAKPARTKADIVVTQNDIADRPYTNLGDITVQVRKTTLFHPDPTREQVNEKLRNEASKLGADAVVLVRYGTVGVSALSWGELEGKGRAVKFD